MISSNYDSSNYADTVLVHANKLFFSSQYSDHNWTLDFFCCHKIIVDAVYVMMHVKITKLVNLVKYRETVNKHVAEGQL